MAHHRKRGGITRGVLRNAKPFENVSILSALYAPIVSLQET